MARKRRNSNNIWTQIFNQNSLKVLLGVVATGSFVIAFGQEKISQWTSLVPSTGNNACLTQFYRETPPYLLKNSLKKDSYPDFYGTTYSSSGFWLTPPDNIEIWNNPKNSDRNISVKIVFITK